MKTSTHTTLAFVDLELVGNTCRKIVLEGSDRTGYAIVLSLRRMDFVVKLQGRLYEARDLVQLVAIIADT